MYISTTAQVMSYLHGNVPALPDTQDEAREAPLSDESNN
jgi:hypothetical protein